VKRQEEYLARSQWAKCKRWRLYYIWHGLIGLQLLDRVSDLYRDFRTTVWDVNSEQACPPLSTFLAKGIFHPWVSAASSSELMLAVKL
jgi:hypothetical protein